jgi:LmbE family N-acetylglucosaminyl deacetylase
MNVHKSRRLILLTLGLVLVLAAPSAFDAARSTPAAPAAAVPRPPLTAAEILQELKSFRVMATVLHVAAHPDDENTQLIAYLARGRGFRTGYLSLTRGDGGQNALGPELGEKLGVARTQELLAARRIDGGRQFFTRALDFGFSKDYAETLEVWDHRAVLGDVVRVIREFQPDVIITRFTTVPGGTHGHHTASAVLALEAFDAAGDPRAFPEQLAEGLEPWQPTRIFSNAMGGRGAGPVVLDIGGDDPVHGWSFASIASQSRGMHRTQNFGPGQPLAAGGPSSPQTLQWMAGAPAVREMLEGIDTTWNRVPGGAEVTTRINDIIARFDARDPSASLPALLELRSRVAAVRADPVVLDKRRQLDAIVQAVLGIEVSTTVPTAEVVPGEALALRHTVSVSGRTPVRWLEVRYPASGGELSAGVDLSAGDAITRSSSQTLPRGTPVSQPYWLREPPTAGMFRVDDPRLVGRPENPPAFPVEWVFQVGGQTLLVPDEPLTSPAATDSPALNPPTPRRVDVIAPVSLRLPSEVVLFAPGATRAVTVEVEAHRPGSAGVLRLEAAPDWRVAPEAQPFQLGAPGERRSFTFNVTAPATEGTADFIAAAEVGSTRWNTQYLEIRYEHLPVQILQPRARVRAVTLAVVKRGAQVGYLPGAGDRVPDALAQLGYQVTTLAPAGLTTERLRGLDAVVLGIRAANVRADLGPALPALFEYARGGGTVIAQYNQNTGLQAIPLAPLRLELSGDRVTDERARVTFLAPEHPVLTSPNRITEADFAGWVQERGLYYPGAWDEAFTPILASADPGEPPLEGGLLVARYGSGWFVYTSLALFRQLPAGVPGAYRLLANLVSLGR